MRIGPIWGDFYDLGYNGFIINSSEYRIAVTSKYGITTDSLTSPQSSPLYPGVT